MATVHRAANSVEDVFERLETVRQFVKSRRQIDLSKRDIEFLLEYRDKMIARSDELTRKSCELECVRRILKHEEDGTEESLADLARVTPVPETELTCQLYRMTILLKAMRIACKESLGKTKNGSQMVIPRDLNATPVFYGIIKENLKKKEPTFDKEIERLTKLCLWINQQTDKPVKKKASTSQDRSRERGREGAAKTAHSSVRTPRESVTKSDIGSIPPTPAPTKSNQNSTSKKRNVTFADQTTGGANSNLSYTLHLLLNTHPATSKIKALKKLPNLEEKMRYLLDDFGALQEIVPPSITVKKISRPEPPPDAESKPPSVPQAIPVHRSQQTDSQSSADDGQKNQKMKREHRSSQTTMEEPTLHSNVKRSLSHQSSTDEVFLSNSMSQNMMKDQTEEATTNDKLMCHRCKHVQFMTDHYSPINEEWEDDLCHSSLGSTAITAGKANMDRRMSHDLDSIVDHNGNYTDELVLNGLNLTKPEVEQIIEQYQRLHNQTGTAETQVEMQSRAVSARSTGYTPAARRTVRMKNSSSQTEEIPDIENMDPAKLFSDDVADEPLRQSYSDYRPSNSIEYSGGGFDPGRGLLSPDSEANIMWRVSNNLNPGQWKKLFTKLMNQTDHIIPPQEIKEEISSIVDQHQGDKTQGMAALELWRQTNGVFRTDILLETLGDIRRNDIVQLIKKYVARSTHSLHH